MNWNLLFQIFTFISMVVVIILVGHMILSYPAFKNQCESLGGTYYEIANVTCSDNKWNCDQMCILNGEYINYYDGDLCVIDCMYKNKHNPKEVCVC